MVLSNEFCEVDMNEAELINGGGATAFVYALGFIAGTTPLNVCIGAGLVIAGAGCCIYGAVTH